MTGYYLPFGPDIPRTQDFGNPQRNAIMGNGAPHGGDDYGTPVGTPVRAAGDGVIDYAGVFDDTWQDNYAWNTSMAGLILWLNCGDLAPSFEYGHLWRVLVKPGDRVKAGQVIALTGNSGGSTGPHCHVGALPPRFDLNTPTHGRVNPRTYMTRYWAEPTPNAVPAPIQEENPMRIIARQNGTDEVYIGDYITRRHVPDEQTLQDLQWAARNNFGPAIYDSGKIQNVERIEFIGKLVKG